MNIKQKKWIETYAKRRDKILAYQRKYYQSHKLVYELRNKKRYIWKKDEVLEKAKAYYRKNKKKIRESQRIFYQKNKKRILERQKIYHQKVKALKRQQ